MRRMSEDQLGDQPRWFLDDGQTFDLAAAVGVAGDYGAP